MRPISMLATTRTHHWTGGDDLLCLVRVIQTFFYYRPTPRISQLHKRRYQTTTPEIVSASFFHCPTLLPSIVGTVLVFNQQHSSLSFRRIISASCCRRKILAFWHTVQLSATGCRPNLDLVARVVVKCWNVHHANPNIINPGLLPNAR
jgi:hypothetical protein